MSRSVKTINGENRITNYKTQFQKPDIVKKIKEDWYGRVPRHKEGSL